MSKVLEIVRTKVSLVLGVSFLVLIGMLVFQAESGPRGVQNQFASPAASLSSGVVLSLDVADTYRERVLGLSGRESLAEGTGLLFVFDRPGMQGIWMKDMKFPIDVIWLDAEHHIVGLKENAQPQSYPEVFYPESDALYVVEVNTGFISQNALQMGQTFFVE